MQADPSAARRDGVAEIMTALAPGLAAAVAGRGEGTAQGRSGPGATRPARARAGAARPLGPVWLVDGAPGPIPHNPVAAALRHAALAVTLGCAAFGAASLCSLF